jgi:hypothetical protein
VKEECRAEYACRKRKAALEFYHISVLLKPL